MHGFEYQAAIHMIQEGMEKEGLEMVAGIRNRYTGENRNPWNEIEFGSNYARSMASYALLLAYSGFSCNMTNLEIGFAPLREGSYFWSLDNAWGVFEQKGKTGTLRVLYGAQRLRRIRLGWAGIRDISLGEAKLGFKTEETTLVLDEPLVLNEGQALVLR
jgi:hypothetical protein